MGIIRTVASRVQLDERTASIGSETAKTACIGKIHRFAYVNSLCG